MIPTAPPPSLVPTNTYNKSLYKAWGDQADMAHGQGWFPETSFNGETVYRSPYDNAFNNVVLPNSQSRGHIALIGHDNQMFDIVIRDAKGNILNYIHKGISPKDVQTYITNASSSVAKRNASIIQGKNADKWQSNGTYVASK